MLKLKQLTKQYKTFHLGPIDAQLERGTVAAIVGPNGSGKSTLLRLIMNVIQADHGEVDWNGKSMKEDEVELKKQIAYAGGNLYEIFGHLSIKELADFVSHWYPSWSDERWNTLAARYDIDLSKKYADCSTGTKKKVEFVLAIAHQPSLLLLDEPSNGLDMVSQRKMKEDLLQYLEDGQRSIILATHQQEEVQQLCDFIFIMQDGKMIYTIDKDDAQQNWARLWTTALPDSLRSHPNVKEISDSSMTFVTDNLPVIRDALQRQGITITHIQRLELTELMEYVLNARSIKF